MKLRQVEVLMGQGMPREEWRNGHEKLKELKRLQNENEHLRRAVTTHFCDPIQLTGQTFA